MKAFHLRGDLCQNKGYDFPRTHFSGKMHLFDDGAFYGTANCSSGKDSDYIIGFIEHQKIRMLKSCKDMSILVEATNVYGNLGHEKNFDFFLAGNYSFDEPSINSQRDILIKSIIEFPDISEKFQVREIIKPIVNEYFSGHRDKIGAAELNLIYL